MFNKFHMTFKSYLYMDLGRFDFIKEGETKRAPANTLLLFFAGLAPPQAGRDRPGDRGRQGLGGLHLHDD